MIGLIRKADNRFMNERQGSDWRKNIFDPRTKITKGEQLIKLLDELENLPKTEAQKIKELNKAIDTLQSQWQTWLYDFRERYAKKHQGVAEEYFTIDIPPEITQRQYFSARYIEYDGENVTFDCRPAYTIEGSVIICTSGWAVENECLLEDDVTDFSNETLTEPVYFQLWYAQNEATHEISIQLLVRNDDEDFSELPGNLRKRGKYPVCQGRVNVNNSITIGEF